MTRDVCQVLKILPDTFRQRIYRGYYPEYQKIGVKRNFTLVPFKIRDLSWSKTESRGQTKIYQRWSQSNPSNHWENLEKLICLNWAPWIHINTAEFRITISTAKRSPHPLNKGCYPTMIDTALAQRVFEILSPIKFNGRLTHLILWYPIQLNTSLQP